MLYYYVRGRGPCPPSSCRAAIACRAGVGQPFCRNNLLSHCAQTLYAQWATDTASFDVSMCCKNTRLWHLCNKSKGDAQKCRNKCRTNIRHFIYIKGNIPIPLKSLHIQKKCNQSAFLFVNEINGLISKSLKTLTIFFVVFLIRFVSNQNIESEWRLTRRAIAETLPIVR